MTELVHETSSSEETEELGRVLGAAVCAGDVLALSGELGAGKTVLVRGICAGVGGNADEVRSPTFVIEHIYKGGRLPLHHIDCYRLGAGANLDVLDLNEATIDGAAVVEWSEYADLRRHRPVSIRIEVLDGDHRRFTLLEATETIRQAWPR